MKFNNTKKQEKGSLIIEALAVLGLIALLTPLLFQQISRRNEEISNANIATEIRSIKNALSAYIQANEYSLSKTLGLIDHDNYKEISADNPQSTENVSLNALQSYGFSLSNIPSDEYTILIQGYTLPVEYTFLEYTFPEGEAISRGTKYRPVIYGIVLGKTGYSLRRAGKIASLIGLDGGVMLNDGVFQGVDGAWSFETDDTAFTAGAVGAVTIFDVATNSAILEGVKIKDYIGKTVQTTSGAIEQLHIPSFFAVGDALHCIEDYKNPDFSINREEDKCAPLFEVYEDTESGEFFVKMREGRIETRKVAFSNSDTEGDETTLRVPSDFMGTINTEGTQNYLLDPAYTSVMNDIRLTSRGGARLSEILPDYINKGIYFISSPQDINIPQCPIGYAPAVAIIPIRANATYSFNEDNFKVEQGKIKRDESSNEEDITVEHGFIRVEDETNRTHDTEENYVIENNDVNLGSSLRISLCKPGSSCEGDSSSAAALVYTYCVYTSPAEDFTTTRSNTSTSTEASTSVSPFNINPL